MINWKHQSLGIPWTERMESYEYQVPVLHVSSCPLEGNINSSITSFYSRQAAQFMFPRKYFS